MRFKIISSCLICILILSLAGCQNLTRLVVNDYPTESPSEKIMIKWMVYGEEYKDSDLVFEEFNKELQHFFKDTEVHFEVVDKTYYKDKWDMKMATNETLDLAWVGNELFNYTDEVKRGSFMALDFLLSAYGNELSQSIPQHLWDLQKRDGSIFAIPIEGVMYRSNMAMVTKSYYMSQFGGSENIKKANFESQYTLRDQYKAFEPYFEYVKTYEDIGSGISYKGFRSLADKGLEGIYGADSPFVIKIFDDKVTVYNKYQLDIYRDYFETMADWYQKGYIRKDIADVVNPISDEGKVKGSLMFLDNFEDTLAFSDRIHTDYEAVYIPIQDYRYMAYDSCENAIVIPKSSDNPQRALEIMNLLLSEEGKDLYRLLVNGIESKHYIVLEDERIVRLRDNEDKLLYGLSPYTLGDVFQNYQLNLSQATNIKSNNAEAISSKLQGFNLDTRMIVIELTKMDLVIDAYLDGLSRGNDVDWQGLYTEFLEKMTLAGSEKIVDEMQRQIDEYRRQE